MSPRARQPYHQSANIGFAELAPGNVNSAGIASERLKAVVFAIEGLVQKSRELHPPSRALLSKVKHSIYLLDFIAVLPRDIRILARRDQADRQSLLYKDRRCIAIRQRDRGATPRQVRSVR